MTKTGLFNPSNSRMALLALICLLAFSGKSDAQNKKRIEILHCDVLDYNARIIANAQRLLGNVNITVDGALMWCDSLYSYTSTNSVDAFGNVHIIRGDTLNMYADFIHYSGETKLAKARRNVKLIDKKVTLTTDSLDYTMVNDIASYNYFGTVKDTTNVLTSIVGQYFVNQKKAHFTNDVKVVTKDYKIKSEALTYLTDTKKVIMEGPTWIYNEKDTLYAEYGWYDSMQGYARLTKKPKIWNAKQKVKADSIYYDKKNGEGLAMGHARIQDIENSIIVLGNRVQYNDLTKIASATDSAVLIQYSETDSLYLHADYLRTMPDTIVPQKTASVKKLASTFAGIVKVDDKSTVVKTGTDTLAVPSAKTIPLDTLAVKSVKPILLDTIPLASGSMNITPLDSIKLASKTLATDTLVVRKLVNDTVTAQTLRTDSLAIQKKKDSRLVLAYNKVRFFRSDVQGKCDSLAYFSKDSTIQLFTDPVIWSDKNQITANYIEMINRSKDPDEIRMKEDAFIISMDDDSLRFNQIKGKNMTGLVRNNELYRIDVNGNGQSNYYARDQNGVIGLNKAESSNITIYMTKGKVKKIAFIKSPEGELKPLGELEDGDKLLPGFMWQAELRPKNKEDIFRQTVSGTKSKSKPKIIVTPAPVKEIE